MCVNLNSIISQPSNVHIIPSTAKHDAFPSFLHRNMAVHHPTADHSTALQGRASSSLRTPDVVSSDPQQPVMELGGFV